MVEINVGERTSSYARKGDSPAPVTRRALGTSFGSASEKEREDCTVGPDPVTERKRRVEIRATVLLTKAREKRKTHSIADCRCLRNFSDMRVLLDLRTRHARSNDENQTTRRDPLSFLKTRLRSKEGLTLQSISS